MSETQNLSILKTTRKRGDEKFLLNDQPLPATLLDFWKWAASDLIGNTSRGILAEFIVAKALGLAEDVRADWLAFDLQTKDGLKIEVKSSAYIQSWHQKKLSRISFSICPARSWNPLTNTMTDEPKRHADLYVFCLVKHAIKDSLNPLNLDHWEFYILPSSKLDGLPKIKDKTRKSISLEGLKKLKPELVRFSALASAINAVADDIKDFPIPVEEIFDLVNEHDKVVGRKSRREVHRDGDKHRAVHVLVFNSRGEVFLQKRSMTKDTFPGAWDSSSSGHLDCGEKYDACAVREVREELGLRLESCPKRLFKIDACAETGQEFVWVYRCENEGPFTLHPEEIERGEWFAPEFVTKWISKKPKDFASAFVMIWKKLATDGHG